VTVPPPLAAAPTPGHQPAGTIVGYDDYIEQQIRKTGLHVKLVDIAWALMTLAAAWLALLLGLALVDHWIVGLSFWGRLAAFVVLVAGSVVFFLRQLGPPLLRRVNPVFAARTIEQVEPSLKNSLINLLLFRARRGEVRDVVYEAMERQAAIDLSRVPVDAAVDRTQLVRVAAILAGLLIIGGLYKTLSPKDPFQTVARIAMPWKSIARPSRVQLADVLPGHTAIYQGRTLPVSAQVLGLDAGAPVTLYYSTADGQLLDQAVPLAAVDGSPRFATLLLPGGNGIQQDLIYRIEAGDAVSENYRVRVLEAPSIVVQQIEYEFPDYTGLPSQVVPRQGDIRALEGTRVTLVAAANLDIQTAQLEFDPPTTPEGDPDRPPVLAGRGILPMQAVGREARVSFTLTVQEDRQTPTHHSYQLRFATPDRQGNEDPIVHRIEVIPDLPPWLEILVPETRETEVPENGQQLIQLRAVDPDFQLARITLQLTRDGESVLQAELLEQPQSGQAVVTYPLVPRKLGLVAGDVVQLQAVAADNRTAPLTASPEPNTARTDTYTLRIIPGPPGDDRGTPEDQEQPGLDPQPSPDDQQGTQEDHPEGAAPEGQNGQPGEEGPDGSTQEGAAPEGQNGQPGEEGPDGPTQEGAAPEGQNGQPGEEGPDGPTQEGAGANQQPADSQPSDQPQQGQAGAQGERSDTGQPSDQEGPEQSGDGSQPGESSGGSDRPSAPADLEAAEREPGANGTANPSAGQAPPEGAGDTRPQDGQPSEKPGTAGREPLPSDGTRDGDAIERILEHMRQQQGAESVPREGPDTRQNAGGRPEDGQARETGAGQDDQRSDQAPDAQGENRPRPLTPSDATPAPQPSQQPQSPSISPRQSDSQGGQDGDRSGGGEQGGGQNAARPGHDNAGSTTPDDDGAGTAPEPGAGDPSRQPGSEQPASSQTGQPGNEQGAGSTSRPGAQPDGDRPESGEPPAGRRDPGASGARDGAGQDASEQPSTGAPAGQPQNPAAGRENIPSGGARPAGPDAIPQPAEPGADPGDDPANLQYARKATDLALEYLRDQKDNPDPQLLDQLGWNQDELKRFLERWESMRQRTAEAGADGRQAREELDEVIRSLGLRPQPERLRTVEPTGDILRGLQDEGGRSRPPANYLQQYRAYLKSTSRTSDP